jgi:hypothetical protein
MYYVGQKAQIHDTKLGKKDGPRSQISSVGRKLFYEFEENLGIILFSFYVI